MGERNQGVSQLVNLLATILIVTILVLSFSGCEVVEFIFKAGLFIGILVVVGIIGLFMMVRRAFKRRA